MPRWAHKPLQRFLAASTLAFLTVSPVLAAPPVIVANPSVGITSVTKDELSRIYLKKLRTWRDGKSARPVDQVPGPLRETFSDTVHERSVISIELYWKRMIFAGRAIPPFEAGTDEEVLDFVRSTPGAVGYVSTGAALEGVKTLRLEE